MTEQGPVRSKVAVVAHERKLSPRSAGALRTALHDVGLPPMSWRSISTGSAATKAVRRALEHGAETVVVCGGDGTVRAAVEAIAGTGIPLAVLPSGTANLFATAIGLPEDPVDLARLVASGTVRTLDTGHCNGFAFAVMGGTGLDTAVIDTADQAKARLGTLAYVRAGVNAVRDRTTFAADVRVDGTTFFSGDASCVLVGNIGTLPGGIEAFPDARPDDGLLDVAVLTATGLREWGSVVVDAVRRRPSLSGHAHMTQGSRIDIRLESKRQFELDGGTRGTAKRLRFDVDPSSLILCSPVC